MTAHDVRLSVTAPDRRSDLDLLRTYEPIVRYTKGELFFPTAVGPYVAQCSLWSGGRGGASTLIVPAGELTLARLCEESRLRADESLFLRFVERPLGRKEYRRWKRVPRDRLSATGRFTTTGVVGRLVDAALRASLLLRGKVPSGLAAAAETTYRERLGADRFTYYGRVARDGGYVCLQYWFFHAMNDWRSTFGGINDHEADWEMITIYLAEHDEGPPTPAWVAFSSHDYRGDDLRRRWDDPELRREENRPVVFAGAGSHSGAFIPGDYVVSLDPPPLRAVMRVVRNGQRLLAPWRHYTVGPSGLGIPFVDYARGDGLAIGPAQPAQWDPVLIDDDTPWVSEFRGLWGLDTRDRFGGERAPSGPRYERDGSVRVSWSNPLGWAGLLKVAPRESELPAALDARIQALDQQLAKLDVAIAAETAALRSLRAEARSLTAQQFAVKAARSHERELAEREAALNETIATRTELAEERAAHLATLAGSLPAEPPQAHIGRPHQPYQEQQRRTRFLKLWAAVSTPLLFGAIVVVLVASPVASITAVAVLAAAFAGVEAVARRRLLSFLGSLLLVAAAYALVVGFAVLLLTHWRIAIALVIGAAAILLLLGNLRDLRRG